MKGHKINGMEEGDKKSKGAKKTGKLGWKDEGWGVRKPAGMVRSSMGALDISRDTQKEQEWGDITHFPCLSLTAYFTVQRMLKPGVI